MKIKSLKMRFATNMGKTRTINVKNCADEIKAQEIMEFANFITDKEVIVLKDKDKFEKIKRASIVTVEENEIDLKEEEDSIA